MKERPILFSGEMVNAILDGRKTMTRRVIKPQPLPGMQIFEDGGLDFNPLKKQNPEIKCPYKIGMKLWVRETWWFGDVIVKEAYGDIVKNVVLYKADGEKNPVVDKWHPSIYMPKGYSRITLEITNIRVERVQGITGKDILCEGIKIGDGGFKAFENLWNSINLKRGFGWDVNPYVWVIEFRRIV